MDNRPPTGAASDMLDRSSPEPTVDPMSSPEDERPLTPASPACAPAWLERIAHDIRSPVGVVSQTIDMLTERLAALAVSSATPVDASRPAALAQRAVRRLEILADRLSLQAAIERGPLEMYPQRVDLAGVSHAAIEDVWRVEGRREVVLEQSIPERCDVRGDAPRLERAVAELLANAVHHARRRISVSLAIVNASAGGAGRRARLTIEDDGGGVSPDAAATLFQARGPSHGGLGIGLAIAQTIARAHLGEVRLDSSPGGPGARFVLELPLLERP